MNVMNKTIFSLPTDGFRTLCEICWLDFGHKMADRNGTALASPDPNERAPIFLQVFKARFIQIVIEIFLHAQVRKFVSLSSPVRIYISHTYSKFLLLF